MLSVEKCVDVSDIWDIFLHGKNEFPVEFIKKVQKDQIPIPELKTELLIPDYLSNQLTFRNFFASELNQIDTSEKAANEKLLDNHEEQGNELSQESKEGSLETENEMSLI